MGSPKSSSSQNLATKRACDGCHLRKIKCRPSENGLVHPCANCTNAGLECTFDKIPQKKGPKGSRARVLSELKAQPTQEKSPVSKLPLELVKCCSDFFFANMYPTQPILEKQRLEHIISEIPCSVEAYCMVCKHNHSSNQSVHSQNHQVWILPDVPIFTFNNRLQLSARTS